MRVQLGVCLICFWPCHFVVNCSITLFQWKMSLRIIRIHMEYNGNGVPTRPLEMTTGIICNQSIPLQIIDVQQPNRNTAFNLRFLRGSMPSTRGPRNNWLAEYFADTHTHNSSFFSPLYPQLLGYRGPHLWGNMTNLAHLINRQGMTDQIACNNGHVLTNNERVQSCKSLLEPTAENTYFTISRSGHGRSTCC